jgi:hypothetical protein
LRIHFYLVVTLAGSQLRRQTGGEWGENKVEEGNQVKEACYNAISEPCDLYTEYKDVLENLLILGDVLNLTTGCDA